MTRTKETKYGMIVYMVGNIGLLFSIG